MSATPDFHYAIDAFAAAAIIDAFTPSALARHAIFITPSLFRFHYADEMPF